jgi:choline dehydrogenase-like flavoprotein
MATTWECLIIGGGPAGLTAAIYLARYRRRVLVADAGNSRAAAIPESARSQNGSSVTVRFATGTKPSTRTSRWSVRWSMLPRKRPFCATYSASVSVLPVADCAGQGSQLRQPGIKLISSLPQDFQKPASGIAVKLQNRGLPGLRCALPRARVQSAL